MRDRAGDICLLFRLWLLECQYIYHRDKLVKLDINSMKFSTHDLPPDEAERVVIVDAGDGKCAMFTQIKEGASLNYYTLPDGSKKGGEWHIKNTVLLPSHYKCHMLRRQSKEHIFLSGIPKVMGISVPAYFSLDIKTFKIERLTGIKYPAIEAPYTEFLPIILPSIQGYQMVKLLITISQVFKVIVN